MKAPFALPRMVLALSAFLLLTQGSARGGRGVRLPGHVPQKFTSHHHYIGHHDTRETLSLALVLRPHDEQGLSDFVRRVQDPADPLYRQFLTPQEVRDRFGLATPTILILPALCSSIPCPVMLKTIVGICPPTRSFMPGPAPR